MLPRRRSKQTRQTKRPAAVRVKPVSKDEIKKLKREIQRFNNQISLAESKLNISIPDFLPEKITISKDITIEEIEGIRQRIKFVSTYADLSPVEFGNRVITRADKERILRKQERRNVKAKKLLEEVEFKAAKLGRFPSEQSILLKQIGITNANPRNYEKLLDWLGDDRSKNLSEQWRQNYLRALDRQIEQMVNSGLAGEEFYQAREINQRIYKLISEMPISDFLVAQLAYGGELSISFIYPLDEFLARLERIEQSWQEVL